MSDIEITDAQWAKLLDDIALVMLYLGSWTEDTLQGHVPLRRAWKGVPFDSLNRLEDQDLAGARTKRSKSVYFSAEGEARAEEPLGRILQVLLEQT